LSDQIDHDSTEDTLLGGQVRLRQPKEGFRAAIDTVLLAAAVPAKSGQNVLELGVGSGGATLCLLHRVDGVNITGIDVNPTMVTLATNNVRLNSVSDRAEISIGDVAKKLPTEFDATFDHVMMNPPYLPEKTDHVSSNPDRALATKEAGANLKRWLKFGHDALRYKGYLTVIHRADRLDELIKSLSHNFGGVTIQPLWPREGEEAKRIIVQTRKGVGTPARILPGVTIHRDDGGYTDEAAAILKGAPLRL
tara:strand:+ start:3130 stop:3879 length:750 start_codon:yes stop_codon:yes gene_type:complete